MCIGLSGIISSKYRIFTHPSSDSHTDIKEKFNLSDKYFYGLTRDYVKLELHPLVSLESTNEEDWEFVIDEDGVLPKWFMKNEVKKTFMKEAMGLIKAGRYSGHWGGDLYLRGTNITSLPDNLSVGGSLDLEGTNITSLPENLSVGGYLDLRETNITSLPENLSVGGELDLEGTNITSLPENLEVGGEIYRD